MSKDDILTLLVCLSPNTSLGSVISSNIDMTMATSELNPDYDGGEGNNLFQLGLRATGHNTSVRSTIIDLQKY